MRLTPQQLKTIKQATADIFGPDAHVWLFGSRVDNKRRGGDVDLLVETGKAVENPTLLAATLAARVSRSMHGRHVDVVVQAPGFQEQAIHRTARSEGIKL